MKKIMTIVAIVLTMSTLVGCTPKQGQAIAKQLGIVGAVTWIGTDNPSTNDIETVKMVTTYVRDVATNIVVASNTYYVAIYPLADKFIVEKVKPAQQPLARMGVAWLLTGIDTAFAMNPSWVEKEDVAGVMVVSFCDGFIVGLSMPSSNSVARAAAQQTSVRVKMQSMK